MPPVHPRRQAAVLRLALLGNVQIGQHLEDVDDRLAHGAAERIGRMENAVDAETYRQLLSGRFQMDVRRPALQGLVHHFLGCLVTSRGSDPGHAAGVFFALAALADEFHLDSAHVIVIAGPKAELQVPGASSRR